MGFISFKSEGKDIILNSDRIISISFNHEKGKATIVCTDQVTIMCDDSEEDIRTKLGVKRGERTIGFGGRR